MVYRHTTNNPGTIEITFRLPATLWADTVCVAGDFNGWQVGATPMRLVADHWEATIELPTESRFEYRYILNGSEWLNDWLADDSAPNYLGGENSVIYT